MFRYKNFSTSHGQNSIFKIVWNLNTSSFGFCRRFCIVFLRNISLTDNECKYRHCGETWKHFFMKHFLWRNGWVNIWATVLSLSLINSELREIYMLYIRTTMKSFFLPLGGLFLLQFVKRFAKLLLNTIEKHVLQWVDCFSFVSYHIHALASTAARVKNFKCRMYIFGSNQNPTARTLTISIKIKFPDALRLA